MHTLCMYMNMIKDEIITNTRKLLNKRFICISNSFSIEEILEVLIILLKYNIFAFKDIFW